MTKTSITVWEIVILSITFIFFGYFTNRGLVVGDEGYILDAGWQFSQGQVPYKDFWILYPPGIVFTLGSLFSIFGKSILLGRFLMVIVGVLIGLLFLKISRKLVQPPLYFLPSILFIFWGIPQLNFPWPTWFCWVSCLASLYFLLQADKQKYWLLIAGICAGLAFLFKQTIGLSVIISLLITSGSLITLAGVLIPILAVIIYLVQNQALNDFLQMVLKDLLTYNRQGTMWTDLPQLSFSLSSLGKAFFYYFPALFFIFAGIYLFRNNYFKDKKILAVFVFTFLFYLSGIVPTIDLLHAGLVFPAFFILLAIILSKTKNILSKNLLLVCVFLIIGLGVYKLFYKNYAGFEAPIAKQNIPQAYNNEKLLVDKRASDLTGIIKYIKKNTAPEEKIFVYYYAPVIYFLSERGNASRYPQIIPGFLTVDQQKEIITDLKNVRLIVLQQASVTENTGLPLLYNYLIENFDFAYQFGDYQIRLR